jgi:hypothetical protein
MGNHKKKKGHNKKPQAQPKEEPQTSEEVVTAVEVVEVVQKVEQPKENVVVDVVVPTEVSIVCIYSEMSEVESELKKLDINAEKA